MIAIGVRLVLMGVCVLDMEGGGSNDSEEGLLDEVDEPVDWGSTLGAVGVAGTKYPW